MEKLSAVTAIFSETFFFAFAPFKQGDQIVRIFAQWVIVYLGQ
jgi:hypothetical protein